MAPVRGLEPTIKNMKKSFILTMLFILTFVFAQNALAIGQVSEPIIIRNVLRGQEVTTTLNLFNSENGEIIYGLKAEGEIADWTSFYLSTDLENPVTEVQIPSESYFNATVKFTIPEDMPNGEYSGKLYIFTEPEKDEDTSEIKVAVGQRIGRKVSITVTDQEIFNFDTTIIPLKYVVKKGEPLIVKGIYENQGNVLVGPDIHFRVTKNGTVVFNAIFPYPENEELIRPFERREFPSLIEWQTIGQESGSYKAEIEVLINDEVYQEKSFKFYIKQGGLAGIVKGISDFNWRVNWWIIAIALIVILAIIFISVSRKKKKIVNSNW